MNIKLAQPGLDVATPVPDCSKKFDHLTRLLKKKTIFLEISPLTGIPPSSLGGRHFKRQFSAVKSNISKGPSGGLGRSGGKMKEKNRC
uniref:Uncharacterized protein n=1 Tax=Romanomermis culicivorax TaxID=13658 RepID=A0A915JL46_ROMCU